MFHNVEHLSHFNLFNIPIKCILNIHLNVDTETEAR